MVSIRSPSYRRKVASPLCAAIWLMTVSLGSGRRDSAPSPTKVKDNFKSLPFDTVTAGPARVMILDELLVAFKTEYEAGNLESFISCMSKSTFSLPWPACSGAI